MSSRTTPNSNRPVGDVATFSIDVGAGGVNPRDAAFSMFSDITGINSLGELRDVFLSDPGVSVPAGHGTGGNVALAQGGYLLKSTLGDAIRFGVFQTLVGAYAQACVEIAMQRDGTTQIAPVIPTSNVPTLRFLGTSHAGMPVEISIISNNPANHDTV